MTKIKRVSMTMSSWEGHQQRRIKARKEKKKFLVGMHIIQLLAVLSLTVGLLSQSSNPQQHIDKFVKPNRKVQPPSSTNQTATASGTAATRLERLRKNLHPRHSTDSSPSNPLVSAALETTTKHKSSSVDGTDEKDRAVEEYLARSYPPWPNTSQRRYSWCHIRHDRSSSSHTTQRKSGDRLDKKPEGVNDGETMGSLTFVKTHYYDNDNDYLLLPGSIPQSSTSSISSICSNITWSIAHRIGNQIIQKQQQQQQNQQQEYDGMTSSSSSPVCNIQIIDTYDKDIGSIVESDSITNINEEDKLANETVATKEGAGIGIATKSSTFLWTIVYKPSKLGFLKHAYNHLYGSDINDKDDDGSPTSVNLHDNMGNNNSSAATANVDTDGVENTDKEDKKKIFLTLLNRYNNMQYNQIQRLLSHRNINGDDGNDNGEVRKISSTPLSRYLRDSRPDAPSTAGSNHISIYDRRQIDNARIRQERMRSKIRSRSRWAGEGHRGVDAIRHQSAVTSAVDTAGPGSPLTTQSSTRIRATYATDGSERPATTIRSTDAGVERENEMPQPLKNDMTTSKGSDDATTKSSSTTLPRFWYHVKEALDNYDFVAVADRLDQSLVVLKLLLHLDHIDVLMLKQQQSSKHTVHKGPESDDHICRVDVVERSSLTAQPAQLSQMEKDLVYGDRDIQDQLHSSVTRYESNIDVLLHEAASKSLDKTIRRLNGFTTTTSTGIRHFTVEDDRGKIIRPRLREHDGTTGGLFDKEYEEHMTWQAIVDEYCIPRSEAMFACSPHPTAIEQQDTTQTPPSPDATSSAGLIENLPNGDNNCYVNQLGCGYDCIRHIWQASNGNLTIALDAFPPSTDASTS